MQAWSVPMDLRNLSSLRYLQSLNIIMLPPRTSPLPTSLLWDGIQGCYGDML